MKTKSDFKICFPTGYKLENVEDDFLDINIVVEGSVYYAVFYTVKNVEKFLSERSDSFFWFINMVIVRDLHVATIRMAIGELIDEGLLTQICSCIGKYEDIFSDEYGPAEFF